MLNDWVYIVFINSIIKMKKSIFLLIGLILFACKKEQTDSLRNKDLITIDFESSLVDKLKFSQFVDTIEFIPLETTDRNLIGEIQRVIYDDEKYYIRTTHGMQNANLFVFDKKGKFLWGLNKRGNGPGEYNDFEDFLLTKERINVISYFKFISYDKLGQFIKESKIELKSQVKEFIPINDTTFFAFVFRTRSNDLNFLFKMNDDGKVEKRFFQRNESEARINDFRIHWRGLESWNNIYYFNHPFSDTIFQIEDEKVKPLFYIDYGDKAIPDMFELSDHYKVIDEKLAKLNDYLFINSFGVAGHYMYVNSTNKIYQHFLTLYSRKTGKSISTRKIEDDLYLKGMILPINRKKLPHNSDNGDILWEVEPSYLIEGYRKYMSNLSEPRRAEFKSKYPDLVKMCTTLKEDDNPVLLRIKVKEF